MQSTSTPTVVSTVTNSVPCALACKLLRALSRSVALSLALALGIVYSPTAAELFWPRAATGTEYFVTENVAGLALDTGSTAATSLFLSDLEPATAYEFTVSFVTGATLGTVRLTTPALDGTGSSVTPVGEGSSDETLPDVRLRGEVYSPTAIELFWDRVGSGETRSNMITVIGPDGTQEFANTGSSLYLDDLQPDTSYEFAVVTSHFGGVSVSRVSTLELRTASLFHVTVGDDDVPPSGFVSRDLGLPPPSFRGPARPSPMWKWLNSTTLCPELRRRDRAPGLQRSRQSGSLIDSALCIKFCCDIRSTNEVH